MIENQTIMVQQSFDGIQQTTEKHSSEHQSIFGKNTNRARVYQAIVDLDEHGRKPTRQAVSHLTGLSMSSVAESIDALHDCNLIRRVYDGVWEPVDQTPDRIVSTSMLPQGRMRLEIGNEIMTLTPREALSLAKMLAGVLLAFRSP